MVTWEERIAWVAWISLVFRFEGLLWAIMHFIIAAVYCAGMNYIRRAPPP